MGGMMPMAGGGQDVLQEAFTQYRPEMAGEFQQMGGDALRKVMEDFDPEQITQIMKPVGDYATDVFKQDITPWVAEKYADSMGGAFPRALAKEGGRLSLGMASEFAPYQFGASEAHKNRLMGVPGEAQRMGLMGGDVLNQAISGAGQLPMQLAAGGFGAGGIQRQIAGEQMGGAQQMWGEAQPYNNPWLANYLGTALGQYTDTAQQGPGMGALMMGPLSSMLGSEWFGDWMTGNKASQPKPWDVQYGNWGAG